MKECKKFKEAIISSRKRWGTSITFLSRVIGVHPNTYRAWEAGKGVPNAFHAVRIAKFLGCTVEDLFPIEDLSDD